MSEVSKAAPRQRKCSVMKALNRPPRFEARMCIQILAPHLGGMEATHTETSLPTNRGAARVASWGTKGAEGACRATEPP